MENKNKTPKKKASPSIKYSGNLKIGSTIVVDSIHYKVIAKDKVKAKMSGKEFKVGK